MLLLVILVVYFTLIGCLNFIIIQNILVPSNEGLGIITFLTLDCKTKSKKWVWSTMGLQLIKFIININ